MTTDPIAAARALIAAQPALLFRCDLCSDEGNCHPHHDMSMSGEHILCDQCEDFDNPGGVPDPLTLIATLADALEAERAEIERLTKGSICEVAATNPSVMEYMRHWEGRAEKAETERDTLVAAAYEAAAQAVRAVLTNSPTGEWGEEGISMSRAIERAICALTLADAQAALDKMLAEARLEGRKIERQAQDAIFRRVNPSFGFALPEPKETSHD